MRQKISTILLLLVILAPLGVSAETVYRDGSEVNIDSEQLIDGDYYVSAGLFGKTTMSGTVAGDMYATGGAVTVNGVIQEDLSVLSATTDMHASVTDDVRIASGEVTIAESVGGDVFVLAGTLEVLSTARIEGNLYFFGGMAVIDGEVGGSIFGSAERMSINGAVDGEVSVRVPAGLSVGDQATIGGSVQYSSAFPLIRSQSAVIDGDITQQPLETQTQRERIRALITPYFIALFAALTLFLLFKDELRGLTRRTPTYVKSLAIGAGVLLAGPIIALLLVVTVLGSLLGFAVLGILISFYALSIALSGILFGQLMFHHLFKKSEITVVTVLAGTTALQLLLFVPILGLVVNVVMLLYALGLLTHVFIQTVTKA